MSEPNPTVDLAGPEAAPPVPADFTPPQQIGCYRIEGVLGQGGFGLVYLAYDEQLSHSAAPASALDAAAICCSKQVPRSGHGVAPAARGRGAAGLARKS